ncbi:hypothetical protein Q2449_21365 [Escherichia coli]|uniref:hypothetical protein n=1 Tax=Escherichia sp. 93.1518 TaxID=2723311 RepID=UPI001592CD50|nr:hypothetical protein [Escherichia sp. 93.1518]EEV9040765.1 hypothetical protein [Escherichia coli]EEY3925961.1 hypothetical protein [Escherichia coli]EFA7904321.1 hypothetical protein [Escherichia coli]EJK6817974.1 hypothetical protein [Escherichia coli]EKE4277968.1 hypothetical protein [Escherichia coli]
MKDLTLKFQDKQEYKKFLEYIDWENNETLQDQILIDVIGYYFDEVGRNADDEPIYKRRDGYFVNIRILDDKLDASPFTGNVVNLDAPLHEWA